MDELNLAVFFPDFRTLGGIPETAEQLSATFVAFLIAVAVFFFLGSLVALYNALRRIRWIRRLIKSETSNSILKNRQSLLGKADKAPLGVGHLWKEFDETLVEARFGDDYHLHSVFDANHFFNNSTLAGGITESRMLAAVPGILTAVGVIGTFVGLQLGLSELNIGNDVAVRDMKEGLAQVINGAKIAFLTSVWGVALSVLFNFAEKLLESIARGQIQRLQVKVDRLFPRFSAENQLKQIAEHGAESREALQGLAERIGDKMQESLIDATNGIQKGLEASLEKVMAPAINQLVDDTSNGNQKALEQLVGGFLSKFGEQGEAQRKAMDEASAGVNQSLSLMNKTLEGFVSNLNQNQHEAHQREQKLIEHIAAQVDELAMNNSKHAKLLIGITKQQIDRISGLMEKSMQTQAHREASLGEQFEFTIKGMIETLDRQTVSSKAIVAEGKSLLQQVSSSHSNLKMLADGVNAGAAELRTAASMLKEYGEGVRNSSQQLGSAIQAATSATVNLASENQKSATAVNQIHREIGVNIEIMKGVASNLGSIVQTADSTFTNMEQHQQRYLESLKMNVQELSEHGTQLLMEYAAQANGQTKEHLAIWGEHTTEYAQQMTQTVHALSSVVDEIENKMSH